MTITYDIVNDIITEWNFGKISNKLLTRETLQSYSLPVLMNAVSIFVC